AFNIFDRDHSGAIDIEELGAVMLSIGLSPTQDELLSMIDKVDADSTGTVEFDEFLQMSHEWMIQGRLDTTDQLWEAFELLDLDQNGFISLSDLKRVIDSLKAKGEGVDNMADEDIQDMIKEFDLDGDGKVGFEDFLAMMAEK
ncbi:calmodulin-beta, partial [Phlyctochytrium arcticum]